MTSIISFNELQQITFNSCTYNAKITCSHWVKKEEKFSHSCANIKRIERFLKALQLRKSWNELKNVVLQILWVKSQSTAVISHTNNKITSLTPYTHTVLKQTPHQLFP